MSTDESSKVRKRYAAVESAYTSGNYTESLNQGLALLQDLQDPASKPLRMRLLLLLGHTWLYGLGDLDSAAVAYGQVAEDNEEQALQAIALDGLNRTTPARTAKDETQAAAEAQPKTMARAADPMVVDPAPTTPQAAGSDQPGPASPWTTSEPAAELIDSQRSITALTNQAAAPWLPAETAAWDPGVTTSTAPEMKQGTVVTPSTLSFSPEEEQELAKGLLLVVLN